jgi:hypothetical protein
VWGNTADGFGDTARLAFTLGLVGAKLPSAVGGRWAARGWRSSSSEAPSIAMPGTWRVGGSVGRAGSAKSFAAVCCTGSGVVLLKGSLDDVCVVGAMMCQLFLCRLRGRLMKGQENRSVGRASLVCRMAAGSVLVSWGSMWLKRKEVLQVGAPTKQAACVGHEDYGARIGRA